MRPHTISAIGLAVVLAAFPAGGSAQSHKHYTHAEEAEKPAPSGALAPRLQNLGDHVFPVTTVVRGARAS